jgi:hypothetical protein
LRFSGRLMVIQNACPRFSRITLLLSVIALHTCLPCFIPADICDGIAREHKGKRGAIRRQKVSRHSPQPVVGD